MERNIRTTLKATFFTEFENHSFSPLLHSREQKGAIFKLRNKRVFESCSKITFPLRLVALIFTLFLLCSGYLRKETAVVSIVLPFVYSGLAHFADHLKISHRKKGRNSQMDCEKKEEILRWTVK